MNNIVQYFTDNFGKPFTEEVDSVIANRILGLTRLQLVELRSRLFDKAIQFVPVQGGEPAIFWLQRCMELIDQFTFRMHKVYFSPGNEIIEAISDLLNQAKYSLDLCIFTITDDRLAKEILACFDRGIKIRVITDNDKLFDRGSMINDLNQAGIAVRIDHSEYHMHHKFGIVDNRIVFTGSFNWTYTASKHNQENMVVTTYHDLVSQFSVQFELLWNKMYAI
jgi:phosphatidylserine/phosphatidylglycerophosphate/cardiolipin synthase-like enzyme